MCRVVQSQGSPLPLSDQEVGSPVRVLQRPHPLWRERMGAVISVHHFGTSTKIQITRLQWLHVCCTYVSCVVFKKFDVHACRVHRDCAHVQLVSLAYRVNIRKYRETLLHQAPSVQPRTGALASHHDSRCRRIWTPCDAHLSAG